MTAGKKTRTHKNKKKGGRLGIYGTIVLIVMMLTGIAFLFFIPLFDALPEDIVFIMIILFVALLIAAALLLSRRSKWLKAAGTVLALFFVALFGMGAYYMANTYAMFSEISDPKAATAGTVSTIDVTEEPFNLYITGIDQWNEDDGYDLERSDVNMIVTVNPKTRKILLTSIPRDAYVKLHRTGTMDKLTHTGIYGVDETLNTVEEWMGIDLNFYVKANFDACVDLVEAIGGIDIYNPVEFQSDITKHVYPKGNIHLKGYGALYYARERHAFEGEDQKRVENQQRVVTAILHKIMSSSTLLTKYGDIMNVLGREIETDVPADDIRALIKMQLSNMSGWDIQSQRMRGEYDMEVVASMDASNKYSVLKVDSKSFRDCVDGIYNAMHPTADEIMEAENKQKRGLIENAVKQVLNGKKDEAAEETEAE